MGDAANHDLSANQALRRQLEEATTRAERGALEAQSPTTSAMTSTMSPHLQESPAVDMADAVQVGSASGDTSGVLAPLSTVPGAERVKLTAGLSPRPRPSEAIEREVELLETFAEAAKRSTWNPDWQTLGNQWNPRHQLAYNNDEMSQNCRCYFDRWLDHRELLPPDANLQVQKPTWRLEPDPIPAEQREAERLASSVYSPTGPGLRGSPKSGEEIGQEKSITSMSGENVIKRRSMRLSRDKPWMTQPARFWQLLQPEETAESMVSTMTQTDFPQVLQPNEAREQGWNSHHDVVWSNFQNLQGVILNPAPVRSYFDRPREPDIGARSAEKKPEVRRSGDGRDGVVRILPLWRLEPLPGVSNVESPKDNLWPPIPRLPPRSGSPLRPREEILGPRHEASPEFNHKSTWSCPSLLTTAPSDEMVERKQGWNGRHQLAFQNQEVSRLDRCYFDRFREHAELRSPHSPPHASCSVWSLGRDVSTKESLKTMMASGDARFHTDGKWMHRHQLTFDNSGGRLPVQRNLRSYFDRSRDFPSEASSSLQEVLPEDDPQRAGNFTLLTAAALRKRRCKLKDSEEGSLKVRIEESFRSCVSDPSMSKAQKEKRRLKWMSNHHVVF
ncbi:unnamed protein product [Durusdinium trenchii]|uniref:Uncharacterized protein n=2 Tax=Durusdinium trenchii TaxID=1381693 RepID=A0ABP0MAQ1_9DINO